jgi:hypothetical protein
MCGRAAHLQSRCLLGNVPMRVVHVRQVRMLVSKPLVPVPMGMRFARRGLPHIAAAR